MSDYFHTEFTHLLLTPAGGQPSWWWPVTMMSSARAIIIFSIVSKSRQYKCHVSECRSLANTPYLNMSICLYMSILSAQSGSQSKCQVYVDSSFNTRDLSRCAMNSGKYLVSMLQSRNFISILWSWSSRRRRRGRCCDPVLWMIIFTISCLTGKAGREDSGHCTVGYQGVLFVMCG